MRSIDEVMQAQLDTSIAQRNAWAERIARDYLPAVAREIWDALEREGYRIVPADKVMADTHAAAAAKK
jgi:hypothetical protein